MGVREAVMARIERGVAQAEGGGEVEDDDARGQQPGRQCLARLVRGGQEDGIGLQRQDGFEAHRVHGQVDDATQAREDFAHQFGGARTRRARAPLAAEEAHDLGTGVRGQERGELGAGVSGRADNDDAKCVVHGCGASPAVRRRPSAPCARGCERSGRRPRSPASPRKWCRHQEMVPRTPVSPARSSSTASELAWPLGVRTSHQGAATGDRDQVLAQRVGQRRLACVRGVRGGSAGEHVAAGPLDHSELGQVARERRLRHRDPPRGASAGRPFLLAGDLLAGDERGKARAALDGAGGGGGHVCMNIRNRA